MRALHGLRENVYVLRQAVAEGDFERVWLLLDDLEDDLDVAEREGADHRRHVDHACVTCESTCDSTTEDRRYTRALEREVLRRGVALVEARKLRAWAADEIERRFPERAA